MKVDCGNNRDQYDCGSCISPTWREEVKGSEEQYCAGECHWLEKANYCVHTSGSTNIIISF